MHNKKKHLPNLVTPLSNSSALTNSQDFFITSDDVEVELYPSFGFNENKASVHDTESEEKVSEIMAIKKETLYLKPKLVLIDCSLCQMKFLNNQSLMMHKKADHAK